MEIQQLLLLCGVIAGPLFVIVFLIEGGLRSGYSSLRQPVSSLAIGERGWIQQINFIVTGILMLLCAFGLRLALVSYGGSFWGPFLIGIYAVGLIGAGIFVTDTTGLPSNLPTPPKRNTPGLLHDLCSVFVFIPLIAAFFVFSHLFAISGAVGWFIYSAASGTLFAIGFVLFARGFAKIDKIGSIAGLLQRLTIAIGWIWLALVALHLLIK